MAEGTKAEQTIEHSKRAGVFGDDSESAGQHIVKLPTGKATNILMPMRTDTRWKETDKYKKTEVDDGRGRKIVFEQDGAKAALIADALRQIAEFRNSTYVTILILRAILAERGTIEHLHGRVISGVKKILSEDNLKPENTIQTSFGEIMALRGLSDQKSARAQIREDLDALGQLRLSYPEKLGKKETIRSDIAVCPYIGYTRKSGLIFINFSPTIFNTLTAFSQKPFPQAAFAIDIKKYRNSLPLLEYLVNYDYMHKKRGQPNIVTVKTLLKKAAAYIPSEKEVNGTDRGFTRRIKTPFERDMNLLVEKGFLKWNYCLAKGEKLIRAEDKNFNLWKNLYVKFELTFTRKSEEKQDAGKKAADEEMELDFDEGDDIDITGS